MWWSNITWTVTNRGRDAPGERQVSTSDAQLAVLMDIRAELYLVNKRMEAAFGPIQEDKVK
jgi:hypothetical protein